MKHIRNWTQFRDKTVHLGSVCTRFCGRGCLFSLYSSVPLVINLKSTSIVSLSWNPLKAPNLCLFVPFSESVFQFHCHSCLCLSKKRKKKNAVFKCCSIIIPCHFHQTQSPFLHQCIFQSQKTKSSHQVSQAHFSSSRITSQKFRTFSHNTTISDPIFNHKVRLFQQNPLTPFWPLIKTQEPNC